MLNAVDRRGRAIMMQLELCTIKVLVVLFGNGRRKHILRMRRIGLVDLIYMQS